MSLLGHEFSSEKILEVSKQTVLEGVSGEDCRHHYHPTGTFILEIARDGKLRRAWQKPTGGDSFYSTPRLKAALSSIARTNAEEAQRIFSEVIYRRHARLANENRPAVVARPPSPLEAELYKLAEESPVER